MKNVEVMFPVISDLKMDISKAFGMLQPETPAKDTKVLDWFMTLKKMPQRPAA